MILAPRSLSGEDPELEASVGYIVRLYLQVGIRRSTVPREDLIGRAWKGRRVQSEREFQLVDGIRSCFLEEVAF